MVGWRHRCSSFLLFLAIYSRLIPSFSKEGIQFARSFRHEGRLSVGLNRQKSDRDGNYERNSQRRLEDANVFEAEGGLYPGYGTHFAYVYVGTPPQRVSVIVDTGSHYTAFPCKGCSGCGSHTDPYFDLSSSSTGHQLGCHECQSTSCASGKCQFSQSYSEGSSWHAYQVIDRFYTGVEVFAEIPAANADLAIDFLFGCQSSETGLFRTQLADGIMGMSMSHFSLVDALHKAGAVGHNNFAMCFNEEGGVMSLGGVDTRLHDSPMQFVPLTQNTGWFTVSLKEIRVGGEKLNVGASNYNGGKGTIVDSGTTDTYLNRHVANEFKAKWHAASGMTYSNAAKTLSEAQLAALPSVTYVFGNGVEVVVRPESYMEKTGTNKYTPRIYLDESSGNVLGANFMDRHDVFFDEENGRVGFAESSCDMGVIGRATDQDCEVSEPELAQACDATCAPGQVGAASGVEVWESVVLRPQRGAGSRPCPAEEDLVKTKACALDCGSAECARPGEGLWGPCSATCRQQRVDRVALGEGGGGCGLAQREQACHVEACPLRAKADVVRFTLLLASAAEEGAGGPGGSEDEGGAAAGAAAVLGWNLTPLRAQQLVAAVAAAAGVLPGDTLVEWDGMGPRAAAEGVEGSEGGRGEEAAEGEGAIVAADRWGVPMQLRVLPPQQVPQEDRAAWGEGGPMSLEAVQAAVRGVAFSQVVEDGFQAATGLLVAVAVEEASIQIISEDNFLPGGKGGGGSGSDPKSLAVIISSSIACGLLVLGTIILCVVRRRTGHRYKPFGDLTKPGDPDYEGPRRSGTREGQEEEGRENVGDIHPAAVAPTRRGEYMLASQRSQEEDDSKTV